MTKKKILLIGPNSEISWFSHALFNPLRDSKFLLSPFRELLLYDKILLCLGLEKMGHNDEHIKQLIKNKLIYSTQEFFFPFYFKWRGVIPFEEIDDLFARQSFLASFELALINGYDFYPDLRKFELCSRTVSEYLKKGLPSFYKSISTIRVLNWLFDEKFKGIQVSTYDNLINLRNQPELNGFQEKMEDYASYLKYGIITDEIKEIINKDINEANEILYTLVMELDGKTKKSKILKVTDVVIDLLGFIPVVGSIAGAVGTAKSIYDLIPKLKKKEAKLIEWYIYILKIIKSSEYQYISDKDCFICNPRPRIEIENLTNDECHDLCLSGKAFCFNHLPIYLSIRKYGLTGKELLLSIDDFIKENT